MFAVVSVITEQGTNESRRMLFFIVQNLFPATGMKILGVSRNQESYHKCSCITSYIVTIVTMYGIRGLPNMWDLIAGWAQKIDLIESL